MRESESDWWFCKRLEWMFDSDRWSLCYLSKLSPSEIEELVYDHYSFLTLTFYISTFFELFFSGLEVIWSVFLSFLKLTYSSFKIMSLLTNIYKSSFDVGSNWLLFFGFSLAYCKRHDAISIFSLFFTHFIWCFFEN